MAVQDTSRKAGPYIGTGEASSFPFSFKVFKASDIQVVRSLSADATEGEEVVPSGEYRVTLNIDQGQAPGGFVELEKPLPEGYRLIILSNLPYEQPMALTNHDGFYPTVLNDSADRAVILLQQLRDKVDQCIKVSELGGESTDELKKVLLEASELASKIIPHTNAIDLVYSDFVGAVEGAFDHDFGVWGENDTVVRLPQGGSIFTVAQNMQFVQPVGENILLVMKAALNVDKMEAVIPLADDLSAVAPVAGSIRNLAPVAGAVAICAENVDAIRELGGTLGIDVEAVTLPVGSPVTISKALKNGVYMLTFGIPAGTKGDKGDKGDRGEQGPVGSLANVTVNAVRLNPDQKPTVSQTEATMTFGIPQGQKGDKGDKGDIGDSGVYVGEGTPDGYNVYINPDGSEWRDYYTKGEIDAMISGAVQRIEAL